MALPRYEAFGLGAGEGNSGICEAGVGGASASAFCCALYEESPIAPPDFQAAIWPGSVRGEPKHIIFFVLYFLGHSGLTIEYQLKEAD